MHSRKRKPQKLKVQNIRLFATTVTVNTHFIGLLVVISFPLLLVHSSRCPPIQKMVMWSTLTTSQGRQRKRRESEVEDDRSRLAPGGRQTVETNMDDCLYAQPRRMRR